MSFLENLTGSTDKFYQVLYPIYIIAIIIIVVCFLVIVGVWVKPNSDCSVNTKNLSNSTKVILGALLVLWFTSNKINKNNIQ